MKESWNFENALIVEDIRSIASDSNINWNKLEGKNILVTGATGLIGSLTVKALLYYADKTGIDLKVGAFVRNRNKANVIFENILRDHHNLIFEIGDFSCDLKLSVNYNYIIHAASYTRSVDFIEKPVETILTTVKGTEKLLNFAREYIVDSMVYISSMEVYGSISHESVREDDVGIINWMSLRSSYPQSKRLAETLCIAYYHEYNIPVKIARPTLTFGPGVSKDDERVFAQFARSVIDNTDISLLTKGGTKRDYLYSADAVRGLITILLNGKDGEIYNLSNSATYCSIREMAELCCSLTDNKISVKFDIDPNKSKCYPKEQMINLVTSKYDALNNSPKTSLIDIYRRLIDYLRKFPKI